MCVGGGEVGATGVGTSDTARYLSVYDHSTVR